MFRKYHRILVLTAASLSMFALPFSANAVIPEIPADSGWSGYVLFGVGYTDLESNTVAGNKLIDIGNENLSSLTASPESDDTAHIAGNFEVRYTFGDRWQAFLGSNLLDRLTLDLSQQLGIRKQTDNIGTFQAGLLFSSVPTEVWQDPYQTNAVGQRRATDRDSTGIRLGWDRIMGSGAEVTLTYRDIEIDKEQIGQNDPAAGCNVTCQTDLRRDGDYTEIEAAWLFGLSSRHSIRPAVRWFENDRDGNAQDNDGYTLLATYSLLSDEWRLVVSGLYKDTEFDNVNPIYNQFQDSDGFVVDANWFYNLPTASERWQLALSASYGEADSDIDFHDNEILSASVAVLYRFGSSNKLSRGEVWVDE